jgi:hypothetical protein
VVLAPSPSQTSGLFVGNQSSFPELDRRGVNPNARISSVFMDRGRLRTRLGVLACYVE